MSPPRSGDHDFDAPDVTHAVMSRLGFERVSPAKARRSRRRKRMIHGMMFSFALLVALAAGLHERVSLVGLDSGGSVVSKDTVGAGQAQIFTGLLAPIEELERLLDNTETCETAESDVTVDPEHVHGPSQGGEYIPLLEESAPFAAFPCS